MMTPQARLTGELLTLLMTPGADAAAIDAWFDRHPKARVSSFCLMTVAWASCIDHGALMRLFMRHLHTCRDVETLAFYGTRMDLATRQAVLDAVGYDLVFDALAGKKWEWDDVRAWSEAVRGDHVRAMPTSALDLVLRQTKAMAYSAQRVPTGDDLRVVRLVFLEAVARGPEAAGAVRRFLRLKFKRIVDYESDRLAWKWRTDSEPVQLLTELLPLAPKRLQTEILARVAGRDLAIWNALWRAILCATIQRAWIRCISDPAYKLGHARVMALFEDACAADA